MRYLAHSFTSPGVSEVAVTYDAVIVDVVRHPVGGYEIVYTTEEAPEARKYLRTRIHLMRINEQLPEESARGRRWCTRPLRINGKDGYHQYLFYETWRNGL